MLVLYNILQLLALLILSPVLLVVVLLTPKYRSRILRRLGWGLANESSSFKRRPRVWIHALSVGEASSARPLVEALRAQLPEVCLIFSSTTRSGEIFARGMAAWVDHFVPFPLDFYWSVNKFLDCLQPDLFVLIETDLWPNLLAGLARRRIPALLANGRATAQSFRRYDRFALLFRPLFRTFTFISMQMRRDAERMVRLGVEPQKVLSLGNLKYDLGRPGQSPVMAADMLAALAGRTFLIVAGSTHAGEESMLLEACAPLLARDPGLRLIIAPRRIERGVEVSDLARSRGLSVSRRTTGWQQGSRVLVLDSLGELSQLYKLADIAFVGGSLVNAGGHNPLEPAVHGKPVIFGGFMHDFAEISQELIEAGAARQVGAATLGAAFSELYDDGELRSRMGESGMALVRSHQGATERYVALIGKLLKTKRPL